MGFFSKAVDESKNIPDNVERLKRQQEIKRCDLDEDDRDNYIHTHADILTRILFVYAKLNPGIKYTQGMNELLAIIYYCFYGVETS